MRCMSSLSLASLSRVAAFNQAWQPSVKGGSVQSAAFSLQLGAHLLLARWGCEGRLGAHRCLCLRGALRGGDDGRRCRLHACGNNLIEQQDSHTVQEVTRLLKHAAVTASCDSAFMQQALESMHCPPSCLLACMQAKLTGPGPACMLTAVPSVAHGREKAGNLLLRRRRRHVRTRRWRCRVVAGQGGARVWKVAVGVRAGGAALGAGADGVGNRLHARRLARRMHDNALHQPPAACAGRRKAGPAGDKVNSVLACCGVMASSWL